MDLGGPRVLNSDEVIQRTICVIARENPTETHKCWEASDYGRAVHFEYNKAGTEVWVSIWGTADQPGKTGEIVIYDDATLEEIARIPDLITPTWQIQRLQHGSRHILINLNKTDYIKHQPEFGWCFMYYLSHSSGIADINYNLKSASHVCFPNFD